jgi:hypothetical protein
MRSEIAVSLIDAPALDQLTAKSWIAPSCRKDFQLGGLRAIQKLTHGQLGGQEQDFWENGAIRNEKSACVGTCREVSPFGG